MNLRCQLDTFLLTLFSHLLLSYLAFYFSSYLLSIGARVWLGSNSSPLGLGQSQNRTQRGTCPIPNGFIFN